MPALTGLLCAASEVMHPASHTGAGNRRVNSNKHLNIKTNEILKKDEKERHQNNRTT